MQGIDQSAAHQLASFVQRIEKLQEDIDALNADKSEIFKEAKHQGFDVKAMRAVIKRRRQDPAELSEQEALIETYANAVDQAPPISARDT